MKRALGVLVAVLTIAAVCSVASAGVLYQDDFESYPVGSNMNGQGGWEDWGGPGGAGGVVTSWPWIDTDNNVAIEGGSDLVYDQWNFDSGSITQTTQQYLPSSATGTTYFILLNDHLAAPKWALQMSFDLDAGTFHTDSAQTPETFNLITDQWVEIRANIDLDNNLVEVYYGGTLVRDGFWENNDGSAMLASIDLYANGASAVYYDDVTITPEPLSLSLLGLGGLALLRKQRR